MIRWKWRCEGRSSVRELEANPAKRGTRSETPQGIRTIREPNPDARRRLRGVDFKARVHARAAAGGRRRRSSCAFLSRSRTRSTPGPLRPGRDTIPFRSVNKRGHSSSCLSSLLLWLLIVVSEGRRRATGDAGDKYTIRQAHSHILISIGSGDKRRSPTLYTLFSQVDSNFIRNRCLQICFK
jgi:hypothetical protein